MAKISVIVPVYKVEAYLSRCIDSLLSQTYEDLELILVDDGSPDRCPEICDAYAEKDSRVRVIHQKNRGLSAARNAGIDWVMENSQSQWLMFQDSDDWLYRETLQRMLEANLRHGTPVCVCGFRETPGEDPAIEKEELQSSCWTAEAFYREKRTNATIACGKLYARDCFQTARFPEGKLNEDEFLTYRILFAGEKLAYIPAPFYAYYVNDKSITKSAWRPQRLDAWEAYEQQIAFFREKNLSGLAEKCLYHYFRNAYGQMMEIRLGGLEKTYPEAYALAREKTKDLLKTCHRLGLVVYENDFSVLKEFYPVRTQLWLYYLAARRRLHL